MQGWQRVASACLWLAMAVGTMGAVGATEPTAIPPELQMREIFEVQAAQLVRARDFAQIDRLSAQYVAEGARTSSGLWISGIFLGGVERGLTKPKPTTEEGWDQLESLTLGWARSAPGSATARLAHAHVISRRGWAIRGGGYARTVPAEAWAPFHAHIKRARKYLEQEKAVASANPDYYADLISLIQSEQGTGNPEPVLKEGMSRYPGYYPMYFAMLNYLLPKWHGDAGSIEKFASAAVEHTAAIEGEGMYARIYWFASQSEYGDDLFYRSFAHWDRMKAGFDDVVQRYPDQWNLQNYAKFACDAQDTQTLAALLERVRKPIIHRAWGNQERFEECEVLAGRIRL